MELRRYLEILRRWWWVATTAFIVTTAGTLVLVLPQPQVFEANSTFVVGPSALTAEESVNAFDTLTRGEAIPATYASIAGSDLIRRRAEARLDPSVSTSGLDVTAEVITGTNILSISVRGADPRVVHDLATAIGKETVAYVEEDEAYRLETLDSPSLPDQPVGPDKALTIALGVSFGVLLAVSLAMIAEYLDRQLRPAGPVRSQELDASASIEHFHPRPSGAAVPAGEMSLNGSDPQASVYSEQDFRLRFRHEMIRARRTGRTFSFGVVNVSLGNGKNINLSEAPAIHDLRRIAQALRPTLVEGDVLACLEDGTLGVLLPEMPVDEAQELLNGWKATISWILYRDEVEDSQTLNVSTAVCECRGDGFVGPLEAQRVARSLAEVRPAADLTAPASPAGDTSSELEEMTEQR